VGFIDFGMKIFAGSNQGGLFSSEGSN